MGKPSSSKKSKAKSLSPLHMMIAEVAVGPPQSRFRKNITAITFFISKLLFFSSFIISISLTIWYSYTLYTRGSEAHLIAWFSAGAFVILGFPISMWGIVGHLRNYYNPGVQCYVVRILWMVPIYSMTSWLCLRFHESALLIETLRDVYESYVVYCFFQYLIAVLGGEQSLVLMLKDKSPTRGFHPCPFNMFMDPWLMGQPVNRNASSGQVLWTSPFFLKCKLGVFQYVLIKLLTAGSSMILSLNGLYTEGSFQLNDSFIYITFITNLSQCWALYCLAFFYFATKNELAHIRPVGKFLCVKALIFFTWWQAIGVSVLYSMGMIPDDGEAWSSEDVAKGIQDYLICIEMFIGAIAHQFVFHHTDYSYGKLRAEDIISNGRRRRVGGGGGGGSSKRNELNYKNRWSDLYDGALSDDIVLLKDGPGYNSESPDSADELLSGDGEDGRGGYEMENINDTDMGESGLKLSVSSGSSELDIQSSIGSSKANSNDSSNSSLSHNHRPLTAMQALIQSSVPSDVMGDAKQLVSGEFRTHKTTLLHHAATADSNALFISRGTGYVNRSSSNRSSSNLNSNSSLSPTNSNSNKRR